MESPEQPAWWHSLHRAYEEHNPDEARRLLNDGRLPDSCPPVQGCHDRDYIRWLLEHDLIAPASPRDEETWPDKQERQLQCDALEEAARPDCILKGEWKNKEER